MCLGVAVGGTLEGGLAHRLRAPGRRRLEPRLPPPLGPLRLVALQRGLSPLLGGPLGRALQRAFAAGLRAPGRDPLSDGFPVLLGIAAGDGLPGHLPSFLRALRCGRSPYRLAALPLCLVRVGHLGLPTAITAITGVVAPRAPSPATAGAASSRPARLQWWTVAWHARSAGAS